MWSDDRNLTPGEAAVFSCISSISRAFTLALGRTGALFFLVWMTEDTRRFFEVQHVNIMYTQLYRNHYVKHRKRIVVSSSRGHRGRESWFETCLLAKYIRKLASGQGVGRPDTRVP